MAALLALAALLSMTGILAMAAITPPARADGDPASDTLLGEPVFYPYQPAVSQSLQNRLNATATAAAKAGFAIKVAIIGSPIDLGTIPELFGKPQPYANFLDQEISYQSPQALLVVMATGYGVRGVPAAAATAVKALPKPASGHSEDLATAALTAVEKMSAAVGHPVSSGGAPGSGSASTVLLIALIAAAVVVATTLFALRSRGGSRR